MIESPFPNGENPYHAEIPGTGFFISERVLPFSSRTKLLNINQVCIEDRNGNLLAALGPGAGFLDAQALQGKNIALDVHAIAQLSNLPNPTESPIPYIKSEGGVIKQQIVALGHSLEDAFAILSDQLMQFNLQTPSNFLNPSLITYQTVHLIRNVFQAVGRFHTQKFIHGDIGQNHHVDNAQLEPISDTAYMIDYSFMRPIQGENNVQEMRALTNRLRKILEPLPLSRMLMDRSGLGDIYNQDTWDPMQLLIKESSILDGLKATNVLSQSNQQIQVSAQQQYLNAYLDWKTRNQGLQITNYIDVVRKAVVDYFHQRQTLYLMN